MYSKIISKPGDLAFGICPNGTNNRQTYKCFDKAKQINHIVVNLSQVAIKNLTRLMIMAFPQQF